MRLIILLIALLLPATADAATYVLVCATSCVASDGTTQPAGTALGRVVWDGAATFHPTGMNVVADTGQALYTPTPPIVTTVPVFQFFARFTAAEFNALMANSTAAGIIARLNAYGANAPINVVDPIITGYMAQAVTAGLITQTRSTQILNLAVSSP
jgi:hypothetical protein